VLTVGNDIEIRVKVSNQTGAGVSSVNSSLTTLKNRANEAATAMATLRAASGDIDVTARLDNQTLAGFADIERSILALQGLSPLNIDVGINDQTASELAGIQQTMDAFRAAARTDIDVGLNDQTASGFVDIQQSLTALQAVGRTDLEVSLDDQTTAGIASISTAIRDLRAESPVRLAVTFDDQTGQIASTTQAMRGLQDEIQDAARALTTLTLRSMTAAVALLRLAGAADDATGELRGLTGAAGDATASLLLLRSAASRAATAVGRLGDRADTTEGQLSDLHISVGGLSVQMDELGHATRGAGGDLRELRGNLGNLTVSASGAASSLGGGGGAGGGLTGQLVGVAAVLGASVLPAIGAVAPMLLGFGAAGGAAALAAKDLKAEFKKLKPEFEDLQKAASKAIMPGVKKSMDDWRGAMKGLTPVVREGGQAFGAFVEKAADFANSPAFQGALLKNVQMGTGFFNGFTTSLLSFSQAFLDFGAKSQPSLDAFENLFGGLLDTGLPGMFKGLEQGIGGAADVINGLAYLLNDSLLPSLGRISGSFADAFGPLLGEMLHATGDSITGLSYIFEGLMKVVEPVADVLADGFRAMNMILPLAADAAKSLATNVGGALLGALADVAGIDLGNLSGFTGLSDWVKENSTQIRSAFYDMSGAITAFVAAGVASLPTLWGVFRMTTEGVLVAVDALVSGLAAAFGNLPGGEIFKDMNRSFDESAGKFRDNLDTMGNGINGFVGEALPRLNRAKLTMNVDEAKQNLADLKSKLNDKSLTQERKAKLTADKSDAEAKLASAKRKLAEFDRSQVEAKLQANASDFFGKLAAVKGAKMPTKTAPVKANAGSFWASINGMIGRSLGTSYINVAYRQVDSSLQPKFRAMGGLAPGYADGGEVQSHPDGGLIAGPGTGTSDSILEMSPNGGAYRTSNREYIVKAASVAKYGVPLLDALNSGTLKLAGYAKGGLTKRQKAAQAQAKSEATARHDARGNLTVSHFGSMAGYQRSEMRSALAKPDSMSSLVNSLNQWRGIIMKATHGGTERTLLKALDSAGKKLLSYEKSLTKVTASLDKAKSKLDDLKSAAAQLSNSVKSGVLSSANITKNASGGPVTTKSVMAGLTASRDKATSFSKALADLGKQGLSSSLLQQIGEAGIEGGGLETASALLRASPSEIKSMNSLQSQISSAAGSAGKTTSDAVFGGQIKAQQGLVTALTKSQTTLTKAMDKLASSMEKMIERAFGRKAAGGIIGAASGGLRSGWTMVGEHEPEIVRLPFGSRVYSGPDTRRMMAQQAPWVSMLNTPRGGRSYAAMPAGGGADRPIVINATLTLDGRVVARQVIGPLRAEIAHQGGNVQRALGQGMS
jgi:hypothetical protein